MWLINVSTLSLGEFYGADLPSYAILSHTWGAEEVSFQEFVKANDGSDNAAAITTKAGYRKIIRFCELAQRGGYSYVWVDTCCIDKTSSAELTEAINSMFRWYEKSRTCYAYLEDFSSHDMDGQMAQSYLGAGISDHFSAAFRKCRWLTRGWCLQELLAPRHVLFLDRDWREIGTRHVLSSLISEITGIPKTLLTTPRRTKVWNFPIAVRISWMSKRQTTRVEDMSYSLLGILGVNLPTIYGEGHEAFMRLQGEIVRKYSDLSIFAFHLDKPIHGFTPALAHRPQCFPVNPSAGTYNKESHYFGSWINTQFSLTSRGIVFPNATLRYQKTPELGHQYLLDLHYRGKGNHQRYMLLQKIGPGLFLRIHNSPERQKAFADVAISSPFSEPVCILHKVPTSKVTRARGHWERYAVRLRWKPWEKQGKRFYHIRAAEPRDYWDFAASQFLIQVASPPEMHIQFIPGSYETNPEMKFFVLVIRADNDRKRGARKLEVRVVSADAWRGVNRSEIGFRGNGISEIPMTEDVSDDSKISIAGYDMAMSVELVKDRGWADHYCIFLDWEVSDATRCTEEAPEEVNGEVIGAFKAPGDTSPTPAELTRIPA